MLVLKEKSQEVRQQQRRTGAHGVRGDLDMIYMCCRVRGMLEWLLAGG